MPQFTPIATHSYNHFKIPEVETTWMDAKPILVSVGKSGLSLITII
jgi:hypothetical protein